MRKPPVPGMAWAWFFDIDGTLVEMASLPANVVVHHELPELITRLYHESGGAVSFVTGRAIADVDRFLPFPGIAIVGQHGLEFRRAGGISVSPPVISTHMEDVRAALCDAAARHPGLHPEFKGKSIALHYRGAPRLAGYAHRLLRSLAARHAPDFAVQKGKWVVELKLPGADKGGAIREIMLTEPFLGRQPAFVGDDITDEAGFAVVNEMFGHSIKVGPGRTTAKWRLRDVTAVREWLRSGLDGESPGAKAD